MSQGERDNRAYNSERTRDARFDDAAGSQNTGYATGMAGRGAHQYDRGQSTYRGRGGQFRGGRGSFSTYQGQEHGHTHQRPAYEPQTAAQPVAARVEREVVVKSKEEPVILNVGGRLFQTYPSVFAVYPDSVLGSIFSGQLPMNTDAHGHYFFDRDPTCFEVILEFYRSQHYFERPYVNLKQLREEAKYFGVEDDMFRHDETKVVFEKKFEKSLDLKNEAVFYVRSNEQLEIKAVKGTGRLVYDCFPTDPSLPQVEGAPIVTRMEQKNSSSEDGALSNPLEYGVEGKYIFYVNLLPDVYKEQYSESDYAMIIDFYVRYEFNKSEEK